MDSGPGRYHLHAGAMDTPAVWVGLRHYSMRLYKTRATDALWRPETKGEDYTDINDDILVAVIGRIQKISEASKTTSYIVRQTCDNNLDEPVNMMPEVQYYD